MFYLVSSITGMSIFFLWQPIYEVNVLHFGNEKVFLVLLVLSYMLFLSTAPFFINTDLLGWKRMRMAMTQDQFTYPFPVKIYTPWVYKTCRHPMQSGIMGIIIFANPNYTLGRLLFVTIMTIGDIIGILQEEKHLSNFESYRKYKTLVTNRYIPNILNIFRDHDDKIK